MAVTMKDVRAALDPEEPITTRPRSWARMRSRTSRSSCNPGDTMLASKATYLASLIKDAKSADVVQAAAASDDPAVRVAAAAATANLGPRGASPILERWSATPIPACARWRGRRVPAKPSAALSKVLEDVGDEGQAGGDAELVPESQGEPLTIGLMPGEVSGDDLGNGQATMPGEGPGGMPGEQSKMPGE